MYPTATAPLVLNERLPDPAVKVLDPSFEKYRLLLASVERLSQGYSWAEGPVYFADTRCLLVERHPQQPDHALGRGNRRHHRF